jgi:hypothetical protein
MLKLTELDIFRAVHQMHKKNLVRKDKQCIIFFKSKLNKVIPGKF